MSRIEIRISGFGGQGIVLAGHILGKAAAIYDKKEATFTQSYGPEARGGACSSQVVISDEPIHYPRPISPSILVVMSQEAYEKYHEELSEGGVMIFEEDLVRPEGLREGIRTFSIPATRIAEEIGRKIVANIVMLGFFTAVTRVVSFEAMRESIRTSVPKGTEDLNIEAFERGYEYGRKVGDK